MMEHTLSILTAGLMTVLVCSGAGCNSDLVETTGGHARSPSCPATLPDSIASCKAGVTCAYGGDAHHACTTLAACGAPDGNGRSRWTIIPSPPDCGANGPTCPATYAAVLAAGAACSDTSSGACDYDEGRCACVPCSKGVNDQGMPEYGAMWSCRTWDSGGPGCPSLPVAAGDVCTPEGLDCSFGGSCGSVSVGDDVICAGGYWQASLVAAPCAPVAPACPAVDPVQTAAADPR